MKKVGCQDLEIVNQLLPYGFTIFKQAQMPQHNSQIGYFYSKNVFPTPAVPKLNTKFMADGLSAEFMGIGHEDANTRVR